MLCIDDNSELKRFEDDESRAYEVDTSHYRKLDTDSLMSSYAEYSEDPTAAYIDTYSNIVEIVPKDSSRLKNSSLISFFSFEHATDKAIFITYVANEGTGEIVNQWIPIRVCKNLGVSACTVYVWDVFAEKVGLI